MAPPTSGAAADAVVLRDVRVFDGRNAVRSGPQDVTVTGDRITRIAPAGAQADGGVRVIDGQGGTLMPGLIDAHWHAAFATVPLEVGATADLGYLAAVGVAGAEQALLRGFTTVRDAGGPVFGLKRAIDEGHVPGPRIFPSGAFISQTSGHGDFRLPYETPRGRLGHLSHAELSGAAVIADGVPEVLRAVREQLRGGASQIKLMAGGGVASAFDPIDVTQFTHDELRAAVDAADSWGTYVMVHAYTPRSVQRAIRAGVRCIEHGHLLDDETVAMMAEHDVWWSLQPFLDDEDAIPMPGRARAKQLEVAAGTDRAYELARRHGVKVAWGTDTLFDAALAARQGAQLAKMTRWFTPGEALVMATSANAELLALAGERAPCGGPLGVVEEGALADLLLVDGDPLADLQLLADPDANLRVIMRGGAIAKGGDLVQDRVAG